MKDSGKFTCTKTQSCESLACSKSLENFISAALRLEEGGEQGRRGAGDGVRKVDGGGCAGSCLCNMKMFRSGSVSKIFTRECEGRT